MKLVPSRPITIEKVRFGERWFPRVFRHSDGSLLMYVEYGHDRHFAPDLRLQSHDGGQTWHTPTDNVPRAGWCHGFADGELLELDSYGIHDPNTSGEGQTAAYFGAWSHPGRPTQPVRRAHVRVRAPSARLVPLTTLSRSSYPTFHWWPLWNQLHGNDQLTGEEIHLCGPYVTGGLELDGRLLAVGYWDHRYEAVKGSCVFVLESCDRGATWDETAVIKPTGLGSEGINEASVARLRDGRLYLVARTGGPLAHAWSEDGGRTWTQPEPLRLIDEPDHAPGMTWPMMRQLDDGTLLLVYGRPGKHLVFDPSGTGTQWQGRLDLHAWELETQALMGVPANRRLRGPTHLGVRYWDSGDYLFVAPDGAREALVGYDVQSYVEHWGAAPVSGVRMLRVRLED